MALHLYRRHRTDCDAGRPNESRSSEVDERRKGWGRKCRCLIQISGTLAGRFSRKTTSTVDWEEARRIADALERAASWTGDMPVKSQATDAAPERAKTRTSIADGCKV